MRSLSAVVCVGVFCSHATAGPNTADNFKRAAQLAADDENDQALTVIEQGLANAPRDLQLLGLKGAILLKQRDYPGALAAYQAYLAAGSKGANRREAQKIVENLKAAKSTFIEVTLVSGAADIYLDTKSTGVFCKAAPACKKSLLPGDYKVIAEQPGYERFTQRLVVESGKTAKLDVTLVDKPSTVTVKVDKPGAKITVDDKPYDQPVAVSGGKHVVVVELAGHATTRLETVAQAGKPIELAIALAPLVAVTTIPAGAELVLDDKPITRQDGGLAVPEGTHVLVARARGFHDQKVEIPAQRPDDYKLAITLAPVGSLLEVPDVPAGTKIIVDGKSLGITPLREPVEIAPGARAVEIRVPGYRPYRTRDTFAADQHVRVELGTLRRDSRRRTYIAGAATGAALIAGVAFSLAAVDRESAFDERARLAGVTVDDPQLQSMKSDGERYSLLADVGFGLGIAGIAVTTYLFIREGRGESHGKLRFGVGPTGAMAAGRF